MKPTLTILFLLQSFSAFSQTSEIVKILNRELENEIRLQRLDKINHQGDKFEIVKAFSIKDSIQQMIVTKADGTEDAVVQTTMKILSIEVRKNAYYGNDFYTQKQEVDIQKIKAIAKDVNIIFETEQDAVMTTTIREKGEARTARSDMFFLNLFSEKDNGYLADEVLKAFRKAGYKIKKESWFD